MLSISTHRTMPMRIVPRMLCAVLVVLALATAGASGAALTGERPETAPEHSHTASESAPDPCPGQDCPGIGRDCCATAHCTVAMLASCSELAAIAPARRHDAFDAAMPASGASEQPDPPLRFS